MHWMRFKKIGLAMQVFFCFCMPICLAAPSNHGDVARNSTLPPASLRFERYTSDDGLPNNLVSSIVQDRQRFLWLGTPDGLSRFDGYQFKNTKYDFSDKNSISSNHIKTVFETKSGELWIGTQDGLNKSRPETHDFENYKFKPSDSDILINTGVRVIFEAEDGLLWIGTDVAGIASFDRKTKTFKRYIANGNQSMLIIQVNCRKLRLMKLKYR